MKASNGACRQLRRRACRRCGRPSERIADTEIEGCVAPFEGLEPSLSGGQAGVMYPDAPVEADDNQVEVVAQAEPGVETKLLVEAVETENLVAGRTGDACEPDVPYVEKYRTVQGVPDGKAEFEVGLQPQVAELALKPEFRPLEELPGPRALTGQPRMLLLPPT